MEQIFGVDIADLLLKVVLPSVLPISELRVAIPFAIQQLDMSWYYAYPIAVFFNVLPIPIILLFLNTAIRIVNHIPVLRDIMNWILERTRSRGRMVEKYERIGLVLLVAIPLPFTGAWTGAIVSVLMGIPFRKAFFSIFLGILIAGVIVTCLTLLGWTGAIIAGVCLCLIAALAIWKR